jgi:ABC-type transport system involved in cytochrome c biogenesis permease subunit
MKMESPPAGCLGFAAYVCVVACAGTASFATPIPERIVNWMLEHITAQMIEIAFGGAALVLFGLWRVARRKAVS